MGDPGGTVVDRRVEILLDVGSEVFVSDLFGVGFEPFQWRGSEPIPAVAAGGRATDEEDRSSVPASVDPGRCLRIPDCQLKKRANKSREKSAPVRDDHTYRIDILL